MDPTPIDDSVKSFREDTVRHKLVYRASFVAVVVATWYVASVPWGLRMGQLVPFVAPGAIIGAGGAWAYSISDPAGGRWRTISYGALAGALSLPPFIAFLISLVGGVSPQELTTLFVLGAWVTLSVSFTVAAVRAVVRTARSPVRRSRVMARWRAMVDRRTGRLHDRRSRRRERRAPTGNAAHP